MSVTDVANELMALCREGKHLEAIEKLYSPDIVSVEPMAFQDMPAEQRGIDAIRAKNHWWLDNHEVHGGTISGPYIHGDRFVCHCSYDCTFKPEGRRMQMQEIALYTVADGKVVHEEFFYAVPG